MEKEKVELELIQGAWQLTYDGNKGSNNATYPRVKVDKDEGPHFIVFEIKGSGDARFSRDQPIWVQDNAKPQAVNLDHDQITSWRVLPSGKKLIVFDWNDRPAEIHYRLNFDNAVPLDPIIDNGGGTVVEPAPPPPPPPPPAGAPASQTAGSTVPPPSGAPGFLGSDVSALHILVAILIFAVGIFIGKKL